MEKTDWVIGVLRFISGKKDFFLGGCQASIPFTVYENVCLGGLIIPYRDFVIFVDKTLEEVLPTINYKEYQVALRAVQEFKTKMARGTFENPPAYNEECLKLALRLERSHNDPGGLQDLRRTRPQD